MVQMTESVEGLAARPLWGTRALSALSKHEGRFDGYTVTIALLGAVTAQS
jgi:hypothetical protein